MHHASARPGTLARQTHRPTSTPRKDTPTHCKCSGYPDPNYFSLWLLLAGKMQQRLCQVLAPVRVRLCGLPPIPHNLELLVWDAPTPTTLPMAFCQPQQGGDTETETGLIPPELGG